MKTPTTIIGEALSRYKPVQVALLFSGGHDSLVSTHISAGILSAFHVPFVVYHGDTTIGIPETQNYVKLVCAEMGWRLVIRKPPNEEDHYENIVRNHGFPGPNKKAHQLMYRRLKERALRHWVTHEVKSKPKAREHVLLLTGVRKTESLIRMGYTETTTKDDSRIWGNPIFYFTKERCESYMKTHALPRNPVKDKICVSGECLCGAFAGREELAEIKTHYPHVFERIQKLTAIAKSNGFPWEWTQGPSEWNNTHPPGQLDMFMCMGCEAKRKDEALEQHVKT